MKHLEIIQSGDKYTASIGHRLPNTTQVHTIFKSVLALSESELTGVLLELGFSQRDIMDAFDVANRKSANVHHLIYRRAF